MTEHGGVAAGEQLYVAIDGGNSKTHVVVGSTGGRLLGFAHGPTSSPHHIGVPGTLALLDSLVRQAVAQAGLPPDTVLSRADVYLAGVDLPVEVDTLSKAIGQTGWAAEYRVDNDLFALLRAGTVAPDSVVVTCGAGINCLGRRLDSRVARFLSLGEISGDWGGGHHLAMLALWHAARGEDGRGPATALTAVVAEHFGRSTVEEVSTGLHLGELARERVNELSPVLFAVADAGDAVARSVVARQAEEVVVMVAAAARRLELLDLPHTVVLGGSVLAARHPLLHNAVIEGITALAPRADIVVLSDPPVAGAALLAMDALAPADPVAEAALREAVRTAALAGSVAATSA
ncbi:N-acetylglucosamine kinase [Rugosimonospora africana]|uniref:N-acetylglucosamine kinase n=1 Tax=Rugosimonospora africana TaxID=556532 RepID=A0A8J3QN72_9ACTN|nr:BadF/BadG/BcrA/BcrD ATPase family protein [Rugosimonospora africana]GIH12785.1 N-acetylglucosamine kinase [Rugosimonospora africana]